MKRLNGGEEEEDFVLGRVCDRMPMFVFLFLLFLCVCVCALKHYNTMQLA